MRSMTGFGLGEVAFDEGRLLVEMRSLNHRFLDIRVRVPSELADHGFFVEQICRGRLKRGRFDVAVRIEGTNVTTPEVDLARARAAFLSLKRLRDELTPEAEVPLSILGAVPDLITSRVRFDDAAVRGALTQAVELGIERLNEMRATEGKTLGGELMGRLEVAKALCDQIGELSPRLINDYKRRVEERLDRLLKDTNLTLDSGRLEFEVASFAERSDITEERVRLISHFEQFRALLSAAEPVGRRLDFLLQEMSREAHTIGAKSQDAEIAHYVVELKSEIERMREQVQNVE